MINDVLRDAESRMKSALKSLDEDMGTIRTGRASPKLVENLPVLYYGSQTPLQQLATIAAPEPNLLMIRPFDPQSVNDIERAIQASDLGLTPSNDGKIIRLTIPPLNEERRQELVKVVQRRCEEAKVAVRNVRRDALDDLRELEKEKIVSEDEFFRGKEDLQKLTDSYTDRIDEATKRKEQEIMEV
jgi:ribosome recycling factor